MTTTTTYKTMTVSGLPGNSYQAASLDEAVTLAEADGYEVLDAVDVNTLVIAE